MPKAEADYRHPTSDLPLRPEVGTQAQFKKKKRPKTYRYDPSLHPVFEWDGQNPAREQGEALIRQIMEAESLEEAKAAAAKLKALGQPFLNWAGKAERLSFDVPTLPLFVHERLSTKAILETLKAHEADRQLALFDLFADPKHPIADQVLKAYEYRDGWVNRLILGDSLVVMNSLLEYEGLGGQVQMIYIDPPYGVKFGSNFQPFVRKRDVTHNDEEDLTREPEMVKAYRDTWELGLHSYLTYLRDRLLLARDLLDPSGTVFVQISDENLHFVRSVLDAVFGETNFSGIISVSKTSSQSTAKIASVTDYLIVYAKDIQRQKLRKLLRVKTPREQGARQYTVLFSPDLSKMRPMSEAELSGATPIPEGWKIGRLGPSSSQGYQERRSQPYEFRGQRIPCSRNRHWSYDPAPGMEMDKLAAKGRLWLSSGNLSTVLLLEDNPTTAVDNVWLDTGTGSFTEDQIYAVQTAEKVIARCMLMTTDPGDLVLDPTCGSGSTAYVAERWGRRWITIDTSRVPTALAKQRLLTATHPYYQLKDESRGPAGGFVYVRKQNRKGKEIGGIVPHITLKSIANGEPPAEEVLVDRPEEDGKITRVCGPFVVEATIPTPVDWDGDDDEDSIATGDHASFVERMIEFLRLSPVLKLAGGSDITLKSIRTPARSLVINAEATVEATATEKATLDEAVAAADEKNIGKLPFSDKRVAIVFGSENGAISEALVFEAAREAHGKGYAQLFVIGLGIEPNARALVETCFAAVGIPAVYVQMTPDVLMGDLLKTTRTSQIFSVCGLPEIELTRAKDGLYQVKLIGLDVFDPASVEVNHRSGNDVPAWFLDINYNDLCFHVSQAFFPRTQAWDNIKKNLRAAYDETVWDHLAGDTSAPFAGGATGKVAVKVIDDRGNELMVVKRLSEAKPVRQAV
jgi:adenine-specific DNA-methyltransferase